ncbi:MAG: hypothetical protein ABJA67_17275 [Chthonomonadales bacterium]
MYPLTGVLVGAADKRDHRVGGVLISMLALVVVVGLLTTGLMRLGVSYYQLAKTQADWETAIYVAEAGTNAEIRAISVSATNADTSSTTNPKGPMTILPNTGGMYYNVFIANRDGSVPWIAGTPGIISGTGNINGVSRTIKIYSKPYGSSLGSSYAIFGISSGSIIGNCSITGNVATNGTLAFGANCSLSGVVEFDGPASGWASNNGGNYTTINTPIAKVWPTVDALAITQFGSTGLAYLKTHNDNNLAIPAVPNDYIVSLNGSGHMVFNGKPGGANYYLEGLNLGGTSDFTFDNTLGPITVWVGPSGANTSIDFHGGSALVPMSTNPANPVKFYVDTTGDINQSGNVQIDCEIYNVNTSLTGAFIANGTPNINGTVITNSFVLKGNVGITYVNGYNGASAPPYYLFDNVYTEQNVNY